MRKTYIEKCIMQSGIKQSKSKDVEPVARVLYSKSAMRTMRYTKDNQAGDSKTDAGKQHFATRHFGRNAKRGKAQLNERVSPSPCYGCRKSEDDHPRRALKYADWFFHVILFSLIRMRADVCITIGLQKYK